MIDGIFGLAGSEHNQNRTHSRTQNHSQNQSFLGGINNDGAGFEGSTGAGRGVEVSGSGGVRRATGNTKLVGPSMIRPTTSIAENTTAPLNTPNGARNVGFGAGASREKERQRAVLSRVEKFSEQSRKCQKRVIDINRLLVRLRAASARINLAVTAATHAVEDAEIRKRSLCEQLQLIAQSTNSERTATLLNIADTYV